MTLPTTISPLLDAFSHLWTYFVDPSSGKSPEILNLSDVANEKAQVTPIKTDVASKSKVRVFERGVYTIWEHEPAWTDSIPGYNIWSNLQQFYESWPYFGRFVKDVYAQGPLLCCACMAAKFLERLTPTLDLYQASLMLNMVETAVKTKHLEHSTLVFNILICFACKVLGWAVEQTLSSSVHVLKNRLKYTFKERLMQLQLRLDIPTSESPAVKAKISGLDYDEHWDSFEHLLGVMGLIVEVTLQTSFLYGTFCQQPGGTQTAALALVGPIISISESQAWDRVWHAWISNKPYLRIRSLNHFVDDESVKKEVLGNVMAGHIMKEYNAARKELGDANRRSPYERDEPWNPVQLIRALVSQSAVIMISLRAISNPEAVPLTSIALMQQTSASMTWTFWSLFKGTGSVVESFSKLKRFYEIDGIENIVKDGTVGYPREDVEKGDDAKVEEKPGMKIEFRDVCFKYPTSDAIVIDKLSFSIAAGSTVVIVGENGCGKSSSLKLLSRLYDVTEGEILIDDLPIQDYKLDDLRNATAIMYQDYHHFNLSLRENIGLGNVSRITDTAIIEEAAKLGGAHEFVEKLPSGYDTIMRCDDHSFSFGNVQEGTALDAMIKAKKEPPKEFSGGQTQRLALSRTFMRSTTCDTRLLAYDEPSAALDPKAEFALFERLRKLKGGRTMIFVTHRFGYLTKYADLIIYMDKGKAVEQGSHEELLALDGQYAHLYNVQAQAFM